MARIKTFSSISRWMWIAAIIVLLPRLWVSIQANILDVHLLHIGLTDPANSQGILSAVPPDGRENASALMLRGKFLTDLDPQSAVLFLKAATTAQPDRVTNWSLLGDALYKIDDVNGAVDAWERAGAENLLMARGADAASKSDWDQAIRFFSLAIKAGSDNSATYRILGDMYGYAGQPDSAAQAYNQAATKESDPYQKAILNGLGAESKSDWKVALAAYQRAQQIEPDQTEPYLRQGYIYYWTGDYPKAIQFANKLIQLDSKQPDSWLLKGRILLGLKSPLDAISAFRHALAFSPDNPEYHIYLAQALLLNGENCKALNEAELALTNGSSIPVVAKGAKVIQTKVGKACGN